MIAFVKVLYVSTACIVLLFATDGEAATAVEEIIVSAQKADQNQQSVPIAVTAFTEEQLRINRIESLADVAQRTPGFVATEVNPAEPNLVIRGIGTEGIDSNAGGDASVVTFVDGVYIGRGGGTNLDLLDLERVEVLRGPQGTLFGKNVVGGLVHLITRKPSQDDFVDLAGTVGNYSRLGFRGRFNKALGDTNAVAGALAVHTHDGYMENNTTDSDVEDDETLASRLAWRYTPNDTLDLVVTGDYTTQFGKGRPRDNRCNPGFQAGIHCVGVDPDRRNVDAITDGHLNRDVGGASAEVNWTTDVGTITSITAYRLAEFDFEDPFFSNPVNPPAQIESINRNKENSSQISEELRFAFDAFDARLDGIVGFYYLHEDINRNEMLDQRFPIPAQTGRASFLQDVESDSVALFGELGYQVLDTLRAVAGVRTTWEEKDAHLQSVLLAGPGLPPPLVAPYDIEESENWNATTPRFVLQWSPIENAMLYGSTARGFKSGGFQGTAGTAASAATPYDPEYAWAYELGAKSEWLDGSLRVNVAVFRIEHEDLQVSQLVPLCCVVIGNAAKAEIEGWEVEVVTRPIDGLDVNMSYAALDATFDDFETGATADFSGNTLPRSPERKFNLGIQYAFPLGELGELFARVDWTDQSKIFFEASNTPNEVQGGYDVLDARIALRAPDGAWELAVWGKNLNDDLIKTHIVAFAPFQQELDTFLAPRTYGATLSFHMGD